MLETIDIFSLAVHPDADLFPMLPEDELQAMADDIRENGLNEPLVIQRIDGQWLLIDGRNRREACRLTDVIPAYRILESDPKAFICSSNVARRHMTKGQRAMAVAMLYPDPGERGRGKKSLLNSDFSHQYLSKAREVLRLDPNRAKEVIAGAIGLERAYNEVIENQTAAQKNIENMRWLERIAPDLAAMVKEEQLKLDNAISIAKQNLATAEAEARTQRLSVYDSLQRVITGVGSWVDPNSVRDNIPYLQDETWAMERREFPALERLDKQQIQRAIHGLTLLLEVLP